MRIPLSWLGEFVDLAPGTTVDDGQSRPTRSTCSTPFCSAHTTVCSSHSRANQAPACSFCVSLTASNTTPAVPVGLTKP